LIRLSLLERLDPDRALLWRQPRFDQQRTIILPRIGQRALPEHLLYVIQALALFGQTHHPFYAIGAG